MGSMITTFFAIFLVAWAIAFTCWLSVRKRLHSTTDTSSSFSWRALRFCFAHGTLICVLIWALFGGTLVFEFSFVPIDFDMDRHIQEYGAWGYVLNRIPGCFIIGGLPAGLCGFFFACLNRILVRDIEERFPSAGR